MWGPLTEGKEHSSMKVSFLSKESFRQSKETGVTFQVSGESLKAGTSFDVCV